MPRSAGIGVRFPGGRVALLGRHDGTIGARALWAWPATTDRCRWPRSATGGGPTVTRSSGSQRQLHTISGMTMRRRPGCRHTYSVAEYSWPDEGERRAEATADSWAGTVEAHPEGSVVIGRVIGRQPFGVFVDISGTLGAIGLAEITSMPRDAVLPPVGAIILGTVIGHAEHNHQVKLRLYGS